MLKLVKGQVVHYEDLKQQLKNGFPLAMQPWVAEILDALLVLVAWARVPGGAAGRPFGPCCGSGDGRLAYPGAIALCGARAGRALTSGL
jgi:hypothetical protein